MEQQGVAKVLCQRIGCNATFSEDENPEGSCQYHDSTGKHTTEKPVLTKAAPSAKIPVPAPSPNSTTDASSKETCSRCRQGFFCADHGSQAKVMNSKPLDMDISAPTDTNVPISPAPAKKVVDINEPQTCKNPGCGKTFKEKDNHETACDHHPGPAVFHDRMRGWKCCNIHVKEFDEFMSIPPCTKGWHNAHPSS